MLVAAHSYVKQRLGLDDAASACFCSALGPGRFAAMPLAGIACTHFGTRKVTVAGGLGLALLFPAVGFRRIALGHGGRSRPDRDLPGHA